MRRRRMSRKGVEIMLSYPFKKKRERPTVATRLCCDLLSFFELSLIDTNDIRKSVILLEL